VVDEGSVRSGCRVGDFGHDKMVVSDRNAGSDPASQVAGRFVEQRFTGR
jgi:hypothetical protein